MCDILGSKKILIALILVVAIGFVFMGMVLAADDSVTIDVNVTETSSIIVIPDTLEWNNTQTGVPGGVKYLTIKNAGSLNVSNIHVYMDTLSTEQVRPYGSPNSDDYSAGGVITIMNETDTQYYFAGRLEWNWTSDIPNNDWSAVTSPAAWGYFKNTSFDYVWVLGNGTEGRCNETDTEFAIEYDVDLGTQLTRTPIAVGASDGNDANYAYFSVNDASSPLNLYCVATNVNCTNIYIYHYDQRTGFTDCNNAAYIQEGDLVSGNTSTLLVNPFIPTGLPSGYLNTTTMTIEAT